MHRSRVLVALLIAAALCPACTRPPAPRRDDPLTFAAMRRVADKWDPIEVEWLTTGYFGTPQVDTHGAHAGEPVPIYSIGPALDDSRPVLDRLQSTPHAYAIPVLNASNEIIGEYQIAFVDTSRGMRWAATSGGQGGVLLADRSAHEVLGVSQETSTTLVDHGVIWSIVRTDGTESGVAPVVILDHNPYKSPPREGQVYSDGELLRWFARDALKRD